MSDYDAYYARELGLDLSARSLVIGQLGQSLDGRVATPTGDSKYISGPNALDHLHRLRAAVDAVVVGIGTVIADDPLLNVRRVGGKNPARVVIDPAGRLDPAARCLAADGARRIVLHRAGTCAPVPQGAERLFVPADAGGRLSPAAIVAALRAAGLPRLLIEGGPATLAAFLDAGALDRLHVVVSPVILGSGRTGLDLKPIAGLNEALRPQCRVTPFSDGDVLFDFDMRRTAREGKDATERENVLSGAG